MSTATKRKPRTGKTTKDAQQQVGTPDELARINVRIEGRHPGMLMDTVSTINFSDPAKRPASRRSPRDQAQDRLYIGAKEEIGKVVLPADNLLACFVSAGRHFKVGIRQLSTKTETQLAGAIEFSAEEYPLIFNQWEVHESTPVNAAGSRSQKYLPMFTEWALAFDLVLDCTVCPADVFQQLSPLAGRLIGLGPKRPERKRMYGRFSLTKWEVDYLSSR